MTKAQTTKKIKLKLTKSLSGRLKAHIACANGLGLRKIHQEVLVIDTPENRGMVNKINYLLQITEQ
jgi:large subunit ribosomal protein L30